jgi:3',5'-cyclic AMP phosphodiesterase CpdA
MRVNNPMREPPLYFVHISDTHIGPTREFELYGCNSFVHATTIVQTINALPTLPAFVIHTGDIAALPDERAYRLAEEVFGKLKVPIYFVAGNHDLSKDVHTFLTMGEKSASCVDVDLLSYSFERKGYRFITLDARGPDEIDPHGVLGSHQFDFLKQELERDSMPVVVFVHFPPLRLDSLWLDEEMLLLNGDLLHEMLVPFRDRIRGVFYGHVHRGIQVLKDGILYSSVASTGGQFHAWPNERKMQPDEHHPPCFNFVTLVDGKTIIKEYSLPQLRISP